MYRVDIMTQDDVAEVSRVERLCFANPWPSSAYRRELQNPAQTYYIVVREAGSSLESPHHGGASEPAHNGTAAPGKGVPRRSLLPIGLGRRAEPAASSAGAIVGFAGMWLAFDEAHVTTIGIAPSDQGKGLGELLLLALFDEAVARGANWLTLEVRVSNQPAQALYHKYGFTVQGQRKRYYSDNNEDALIMWSRALSDASFRQEIDARRDSLRARLAHLHTAGQVNPFAVALSGLGAAK